jgi:hypothetical protein
LVWPRFGNTFIGSPASIFHLNRFTNIPQISEFWFII